MVDKDLQRLRGCFHGQRTLPSIVQVWSICIQPRLRSSLLPSPVIMYPESWLAHSVKDRGGVFQSTFHCRTDEINRPIWIPLD